MPTPIPLSEMAGIAGTRLPPSDWLEITQDRINQFADATNDHQFIHTDPVRASQTPFGGTIAHGYLTLSLLSYLLTQNTIAPEGMVMALNYGSDKVRYLAPVKVGQRIRALQEIVSADEKRPGQWLCRIAVSIEIDGESTPALIAEILTMYVIDQTKDKQ